MKRLGGVAARIVGVGAAGLVALVCACGQFLDIQATSRNGLCSADDKCPNGQRCVGTTCLEDCLDDAGCSSGKACTRVDAGSVCAPASQVVAPPAVDSSVNATTFTPTVPADAATNGDGGQVTGAIPKSASEEEGDLDAIAVRTVGADPAEEDSADMNAPKGDGPVDEVVSDGGDGANPEDSPVGCIDAGYPSRLLLFGGAGVGRRLLNDSWQWDGSQWTQLVQNAPTQDPSPRKFGSMVAFCGQTFLFSGNGPGYPNDQYRWNGSGWTKMSLYPIPDSTYAATFAAVDNSAVLFGGYTALGPNLVSGDTWVFDGLVWSKKLPPAAPSAREGATFAALPGGVTLFGGFDGFRTSFADTWIWNGSTWYAGSGGDAGAPSPRVFAAAASLNGQMVLFGGYDENGLTALGDTWVWDGSLWTQKFPTVTPPAMYQAAAGSLGGRVVLFGGLDTSNSVLSETWTWDGNNWTNPQTPVSPPARSSASMTAFWP